MFFGPRARQEANNNATGSRAGDAAMPIAALWKLVHLRRESALCPGTVLQHVPVFEKLSRGLRVGDIGASRLSSTTATRRRWPALLGSLPVLGDRCPDRVRAHRLR